MKWMCCASAVITLLPLVLLPPPTAAQFNQRRQVSQSCVTPDNYFGSCVALTYCPQVVDIFQTTSRDRAASYVIALQRSCGTRNINGDPVICCTEPRYNPVTEAPPPQHPDNPFLFPTIPSTTTTRTNSFVFPNFPRTTTTTKTTTTTTTPAPFPVTTSGPLCRGPDTKPGHCIELKECALLAKELLERPEDEIYAKFLRASRLVCGNKGYQVCCPNGQAVTTPSANITSGSIIPRNTDEVPRRLLNMEDGCGYTNVPNKKIVGGVVSHKGAWPWIALLGYKNTLKRFKCGGTLITARHVVTAAHCITTNLSFVRLGEHDLSTDTETRHVDFKIAKYVTHPEYEVRFKRGDLAIIFLERNVEFTSKITPICLPHTPDLRHKSYLQHNPFVVGWGKTMEDGESATVLNELQIPIQDNSLCRQRYAYSFYSKNLPANMFDSSVICAGDLSGGKDTCQGDSGGPLMMPESYKDTYRYHLIGVVSYGIGCARKNTPGVYTSTQHYMDWIIQQVQQTP
ncbi:venom serine protease Bi-VSP-like [Drosophila subpulchrella]|uniref:venom serine protease Bi-VSP-like n=1 Tax=Drosophila subpulchrella TaxID=1486046 RepID=UPI0018A15544|nr:venom serine protease Bi-VSP-like [Drosophila subpulchrella]